MQAWVIYGNKDRTEVGLTTLERWENNDPSVHDAKGKRLPVIGRFVAPSYEAAHEVFEEFMYR